MGTKFSIVDDIYYEIHPIYTVFAASEGGVIINVKHGSPISCRQYPQTYVMLCGVRNLGCSKRVQRQVHRIVYECHNGVIPKEKIITHINGNVEDKQKVLT